MLHPLRLLLQLDDALLEPLDLPLQRRPLRLFALELKVAWKFMMRVAGRLSEGAEIDLLPISDLSDHCSNAWRDATCGGQIVIRRKDKGRKGISERKSQKES